MRVDGEFELALPAAEAFWLFTPEGERGWVPEWEPRYPAGSPSADAGTVFITEAGGVTTVWVIVDLDRHRRVATYARVTPNLHAGTVRVECRDDRPGHCRVGVRYDLTPFGEADIPSEDRFRTMIDRWQVDIAAYLEHRVED